MKAHYLASLTALVLMLPLADAKAQVPTNPPPAGLVAWWPAEGDYLDHFGSHNGTPVGGVTFAVGRFGQAFNFPSDGAAVTIPDAPALNVQPGGFTAEFWMQGVKNQSQSLYLVVDKSHGWVDSTGWLFQGYSDTGQIFFGIGAGGPSINNFPLATSSTDVLDGQWHHIAGTWDGAWLRLYVDGTSQSLAALTTPFNNSRPVNLAYSWGGGTATRFFRGMVDDLALYSRALTAEEIATHAAVPPTLAIARAGGGVVLSWPAVYDGYGLVSRSGVATGNWDVVTNAPATNGTRLEVPLSLSGPTSRFFRLQSGN